MRRTTLLFQRNEPSIGSAWVGKEQVEQGAILLILLLEVVSVRLRVPLQLESERGMVRLKLLQSAHFALHLRAGVRDADLGQIVGFERSQVPNLGKDAGRMFFFSFFTANGGFPR